MGQTSSRIAFTLLGSQKEKERERGAENLFEKIMAKTSLIWRMKQMPRSKKSRSFKKKKNAKTPRHIIIEISKVKRES